MGGGLDAQCVTSYVIPADAEKNLGGGLGG